jgi:uncharacterized protein with PQ loop repeat
MIAREGPLLRIINVLSGLAVLITTLAFAHLVHHFFKQSPNDDIHNPVFWIGFVFAIAVGIFSFVGGGLLLRRGR